MRTGVSGCKTGKLDQCGVVKCDLVPTHTRQNTDPHSQGAFHCVQGTQ